MKRIIALLMILCLAVGLIPMAAAAETESGAEEQMTQTVETKTEGTTEQKTEEKLGETPNSFSSAAFSSEGTSYTVKVDADIPGGGSGYVPQGGGSYKEGDTVTLYAAPSVKLANGKTAYFDGWNGYMKSDSNTITFTMPAEDVKLNAHYKMGDTVLYNVTGSTTPVAGTVTGQGQYEEGAQVTVSAPAIIGDYMFDHWETSDITLADSTSTQVSFTMPAKDVNLIAHYTAISGATYKVTGSTTPVEGTVTGQGVYEKDAAVTVSAPETIGEYKFDHWETADIAMTYSNSNEVSFTMPEKDVNLIAVYVTGQGPTTYKVTGSTTPVEGTVTGQGEYEKDAAVKVSAPAVIDNYKFDHWETGDVELEDKLSNEISFTMPEKNVDLVAHYVAVPGPTAYKVTGSTTPVEGTVTGQGEYEKDAAVKVSAPAAIGNYTFDHWETDDVELADKLSNEISFTMPAKDVDLVAVYVAIPAPTIYKVTGSTTPVKGDVSGCGEYEEDDTVTVKAPATIGRYKFDHWEATGISLSKTDKTKITFTMPDNDVNLVAHYVKTHHKWNNGDPTNPKTSDDSHIGVWTTVMVLAALGLVGTVVYAVKQKKR